MNTYLAKFLVKKLCLCISTNNSIISIIFTNFKLFPNPYLFCIILNFTLFFTLTFRNNQRFTCIINCWVLKHKLQVRYLKVTNLYLTSRSTESGQQLLFKSQVYCMGLFSSFDLIKCRIMTPVE